VPGVRAVRLQHLRAAFVAALLAGAGPAGAQDLERARLLYETHCLSCHYERMHSRERSQIQSLADLRDMVARRAPLTKHRFTLDEIEDVVQYLDRTHYRLSARPAR
jgi:hypothetical protein